MGSTGTMGSVGRTLCGHRGSYRRILGCRPLFDLNRVGRTREMEAGRSNAWEGEDLGTKKSRPLSQGYLWWKVR